MDEFATHKEWLLKELGAAVDRAPNLRTLVSAAGVVARSEIGLVAHQHALRHHTTKRRALLQTLRTAPEYFFAARGPRPDVARQRAPATWWQLRSRAFLRLPKAISKIPSMHKMHFYWTMDVQRMFFFNKGFLSTRANAKNL